MFENEGQCFQYICSSFPGLSIENMKQGIFNGPDIQNLIKDDNFVNSLNVTESYAWILFVVVVKIFLGNHKTD